jgi:hypothetical protein
MIFLFFFAALSVNASEYKFLAKTISCKENVRIEAREGDKYVFALHEGKKRKLVSQDGTTYKHLSSKKLIFLSDTHNEKYELGEPTFEFTLPASIMSHHPSLTIFFSGTFHKCSMSYKD